MGNNEDAVTPLLPLWLGDPDGTSSILAEDSMKAWEILVMQSFLLRGNGVAKLRSHLLTAKLNVANGADDAEVADTVFEADAFLSEFGVEDWGGLSKQQKSAVLGWMNQCEEFNDGRIGPGSCVDLESP